MCVARLSKGGNKLYIELYIVSDITMRARIYE